MKPLCIDLFCGLGGWAEGFLTVGYDVVGFDITRHVYGEQRYPAQLVLQDVLTLHGAQFRNAAVIVASPPCQKYSWLAMPWSRSKDPNNSKAAKALRLKWETEGPDNRLFDACFRIQREAIDATRKPCGCCAGSGRQLWKADIPDCSICAGKGYTERFVPLIVENVRGAQPWVGRSAWNYGSFHLWGDVPALMPINLKRGSKVPGFRFDGSGGSFQTASVDHTKNSGGSWFAVAHNTTSGHSQNARDQAMDGIKGIATDRLTLPDGTGGTSWFGAGKRGDPRDVKRGGGGEYEMPDGTKIGGDWFSDPNSTCRKHGSRSSARRAASAQIAKIPFPLALHIAEVFKPRLAEVAA